MESFQKINKINKRSWNPWESIYAIIFIKLATQIKKAVDYLAWKATLEKVKKTNKINKKVILKNGTTRDLETQVFSSFNMAF